MTDDTGNLIRNVEIRIKAWRYCIVKIFADTFRTF